MNLKPLWNRIKPFVPKKAHPVLSALYHRISWRMACRQVDRQDRTVIKQTGFARLPPARLRHRVHGFLELDSFLKIGKQCSQDIEAAVAKIGRDLASFRDILDFGCGCGRTLLWFANHARSSNVHGTDIDVEAIAWCRKNLPFARFRVNGPLPPLGYPAEMFDLICAISVFTHLGEERQFLWLNELKRLAKPNGILIATLHGRHCWQNLPPEQVAEIERAGFLFVPSDIWKGVFPSWYQTAYHARDYVLEKWAPYFEILHYIPRGLVDYQDLVILRKS